ncbi:MAG: ABC transporter ATP-binding protein [Planctomycetes bacterium]|nr:ABC transporter ATP-binding protein [Planctomycetota bacterium]
MVIPLVLRNLCVRPRGAPKPALEGVDLDAMAGELHALVGPNGAGKTTLLRVAAGLVTPDAGAVEVLGALLAGLSVRERARRVALVPQGLPVIPDRSVWDFVDGGRYAWTSRGQRGSDGDSNAVHEALRATALLALRDRPLDTISGGERQRALVARALAQDTPVLLCDEPTASLDPDQQIAVLELLAARARDGRAVVVVTHDLNLAAQFAHKVTLLADGKVAACGSPREVLCEAVLAPVFGDHLRVGALLADERGAPVVVVRREERSR